MTVGEVVGGRYEIEEEIGAGGMATVFRARDRVLERRVALKVLQEPHSSDPELVERFRREARAMARLAHPNVVTVLERGEVGGHQYIVFEHVEGETLKDLIGRSGPLPVADALAIAHQVGRGLAFAHAHGVVHRDVKPQNVLLDGAGAVKVTDFGIARSLDAAEADTLTKAGTILGTSEYISPEQVLGRAVDERSDQYSLGVVLFELLTGTVPFRGETFMEVAARHVHDPVPSVRAVRADVSPRVDDVVRRALAKHPEDRFPSMDALVGALEECLAEAVHGPPIPERTGWTRASSRPRARPGPARRALLPLAGVLVAAVGVAAVVAGLAGDGDEGEVAAKQRDRAPAPVQLVAVRDHDPFGDGEEHSDEVTLATDGNAATYWTTERYSSFDKPGVGIVLDARRPVALAGVQVVSDEPGFRAKVQAGSRAGGRFRDVSGEQVVGRRTVFRLDTGGEEFRYYVVWITDPNGRAHLNEVRPRTRT